MCIRDRNSTNLPTTPCLRSSSVIVSTTSVAVTPDGMVPLSLKPTTRGMSIETGWPSIAASASIPPTPQASTPSPLTMVVCESVPTQVSGYAWSAPATSRVSTPPASDVDLHGVVDDQLGRCERVDQGRVAAQVGHRLAHGGQVDHAGHTREVLHDHPARGELDLGAGLGRRVPSGEGAHVVRGDVRAVLGAEQVLGEHLEAVR